MAMLVLYWAIMFAAYFTASKLRQHRKKLSFLPYITMGIVYAIVLLMGLCMSVNREVVGQLQNIGLQSLILSAACVGGSMAAITAARKLIGMDRFGNLRQGQSEESAAPEEHADSSGTNTATGLKDTLIILGFVILGILLGALVFQRLSAAFLASFDRFSGTATDVLLCGLIALVGFDLGLSGRIAEYLRAVGLRAFAFPLAAVLGTLVAGALAEQLFGFSLQESLAISAGFGWYTYAPAVIANAGPQYAAASAVSFLHNMIRETASIVLIPVAARRIGYLEAASMPGISSMDICMPIIESSCRQDTAVYAFLIGFTMNIVASIGVPLIMRL